MKKLYLAISLFLLVTVLGMGLGTVALMGIPEIGLTGLLKGEYASQFHECLVAEFLGKDSLAMVNRGLNQFYSFTGLTTDENVQILIPIINDGADHGAHITQNETLTEDISETEIETPPESSHEKNTEPTILSTEEATQTTETETPTEEIPTEVEPEVEALGQILLMGDRAMELPDADYDAIANYSASVSAIGEALDGVNVYSILVPNSAGLYAPEDYLTGEDSQENMIEYAYDAMSEEIRTVDAYSELEEHKDEYIYFRTDHHWTHLGSYYAYKAFCKEAELSPWALRLFEKGTYETFLGTMYSFLSGYPQRDLLKNNPDQLTYYIPYRETTVKYYDSAALSYGGKIDMVYPLSENYSNKYICFLGGDHPITVIETDHAEERVCLLIKESYGNAFATWLTGHYSKIICVDPREFNRNGKPSMDLVEFAEAQGVDDCIILNYPLMINSSAYGAWLERMVE